MERDGTGLSRAARWRGGFVIPRTHAAVPQSARARAASLSDRDREMTTGRALEWLTRPMRASLLTGTVTWGARWLVVTQWADETR